MTHPKRRFEEGAAQACRSTKRMRTAGLTLVEVSLLLGVAGVLLAVMLPAFVRTVRVSKLAEASEQLETMFHGVAGYYAASRLTPSGRRIGCLPPAAGPTPSEPSVDAVLVDFTESNVTGVATWKAIGFAPETPLRFRYTFVPASTGCDRRPAAARGAPTVVLRAEGDLDDDGEYSRFERTAEARDGELVPGAVATARDRTE